MIAQSTMINKTTITIEKNVNGKIVKEVYEMEGEGADQKLKELEKDPSVVSISVEKKVEMTSDDPDNAEMKKMKEEVDVEIEKMEKVTGAKAERREERVEIEIIEDDQTEIKKYKVKIVENGKEEILEWNGEGEMPERMRAIIDRDEANGNLKVENLSKKEKVEVKRKVKSKKGN